MPSEESLKEASQYYMDKFAPSLRKENQLLMQKMTDDILLPMEEF